VRRNGHKIKQTIELRKKKNQREEGKEIWGKRKGGHLSQTKKGGDILVKGKEQRNERGVAKKKKQPWQKGEILQVKSPPGESWNERKRE